mgnify:FL=1
MASVQPSISGGLNTTLLQVFSMCTAFVSAGYNVTLAMQKNENFENNLEEFINNSFQDGIAFDITTWNQKSKKLFLNKVLTMRSINQIVAQNKPDMIFTREPYILNAFGLLYF